MGALYTIDQKRSSFRMTCCSLLESRKYRRIEKKEKSKEYGRRASTKGECRMRFFFAWLFAVDVETAAEICQPNTHSKACDGI